MSWSISGQGSHDAAKEKVNVDPHVPESIKAALASVLETFAADAEVQFSTHGHVDQATKKGNASLQITTV
jgi:hypothetical protein